MIAPSHPGEKHSAPERTSGDSHFSLNKLPIKKKQNNSVRASAVQITFISLSAVLLTLGAASARNQFERKPTGTSAPLRNPHQGEAVSESSAAGKQTKTSKSLGAEFSPSHECVVVEGQRVRVAAQSISGTDAATQIVPRWVTTGSLATARDGHTATLLLNGKVLVAGGYPNGALSSAELYDPATGTWTPTGSMGTGRQFHTATLLSSGKVLVAGGVDSNFDGLSSAELYDPASGTWTATANMGHRRSQHTATLLSSGKVLVAIRRQRFAPSASGNMDRNMAA